MFKVTRVVSCAIAMIVLTAAATHAQRPAAATAPPLSDMSGMWLVQDPGSGSWAAWFNNVPKPAVRPEIGRDNEETEKREAAGNVVNTMARRPDCPVGNLPMMMASSPPLNIVVARDEVLIAAESGRGRFIYTDGRQHPDTKAPSYVPSGFGHSIGRWEGDTLVVDTIGFPARVCDSRRPVMLVPGGGRAKDTSHLVERFRLTDLETLSVTFTWEDPTVYVKPHTYGYTYKRIPEGLPIENNEQAPAPAANQTGAK